MKKCVLLNLFFLLIMMGFSNAQVRRIVLLEEATNSSCQDCAKSNVKLQEFVGSHFGGVISVRYHAWWPGDNDPMYVLNPSENKNRIRDYYGMYFVADYFLDGIDYGEPLDSLIMIDQMHHYLSKDAPVKIKINADINADSVRATLRLIGVSPVTQTNLKFRIAVIERMVKYSSPPGTNGEVRFPDVMRKMLPDTNGYAVNNINPGEEITYFVSYPVDPQWKWQDLAVVSWLQSDENQQVPGFWQTVNHEIIQSNISIPTYIVQSDEPLAEFLSTNQNASKTLKIINDNDVDLHLRLKTTDAQVPAGWSYTFTYNNMRFDSVDVAITPGDSIIFGLNITTGSDPGIIRLAVFAQNLDDQYNYGYTANYLGVTKTRNSNVLFIDDDGGKNSETHYFPAFDSAGVGYTSIEGGMVSALIDPVLAENFKAVFWDIGQRSRIVSRLDIDFLENYLERRGNLFIVVSDPGFFFGWIRQAVIDFCHNYLDAESYGYFTSNSSFIGVAGTLGAGITTDLGGSYHGLIGSYSGASDTIFQYTGYSAPYNYGGVSHDARIYKTVFLGVGLEQFTSASARQSLIQNVVNWFEVPVGVWDVRFDVPTQYNLGQNYPNPFNPNTTIKYTTPQNGPVTIKLFDVIGREIATLVNEVKEVGSYEVNVNASRLASGVYFYRMMAPNFVSVKKMIVMK
jgi:hypothetical protein